MKFLTIVSVLFASFYANGELLESNIKTVTVQVESAVFELSAKCIGPKYEDDNFKTYFSDESYNEAKRFLTGGYSWKLLDKSCGYEQTNKPQLSYDKFQKVKILFVDGSSPRETLESFIKEIWEARDTAN